MRWLLRKGVVFVVFALCAAAPARAADPLLMFLLSIAREMVTQAATRSERAPVASEPAPVVYPGTAVQPEHLRRLIHDSFLYLSERQRHEVFEALHLELLKPENAAVRGSMIEYFSLHALRIREAQLRLATLSHAEMTDLAEEFAQRAAALPEKEREQLDTALNEGLLPVPMELSRMFVASLRELDVAEAERERGAVAR